MTKKKGKEIEEEVVATVTLRSRTGKSLFEKRKGRKRDTRDLRPLPETFIDAQKEFERMGFKVLSRGRFNITISSSRKHFEETFGVRLKQKEHPVFARKKRPTAKYYVYGKKIKIPEEIADLVERITLPPPAQFYESANAPNPSYHHLNVPEQISCLMRATSPHAHGWTGEGVRVVMVDSGFYNHAYYADKDYSVAVDAVVGDPADDEYGHGTGIATNLLAVAPDIDFIMVKMSTDGPLHTTDGFDRAVQLNPDIITCSWGTWRNSTLETAIEDAVNVDGITVIFACGNGGDIGWPGDMPEVISVGGAYVDDTLCNWEAASYASSGPSPRYQDRIVPDVCGIVGQDPSGVLIAMPTEPDCIFDQAFGDGIFPNSDETETDDGWLVASGTSSAAPMVAGVVALMLQKNPNISPSTVKTILEVTARDITTGTSANGIAATAGFDNATGYGLVDAKEALEACFIATAAYGSKLAPEVQLLRSFRNAWMRHSGIGKNLVDKAEQIYYGHSPKLAMAMRNNTKLKKTIRWLLIAPMVRGLRLGVGAANLRPSLRERAHHELVRGES